MSLVDDGYLTPEIGSWGEEKYRLVRNYADLFATSMKKKWDTRIYIDLFAGAGRARIKRSGKIVLGSPLLAMEIRDPYDKYIFCEENGPKIEALQKRVQSGYRSLKTAFAPGDANQVVKKILAELPAYSKNKKVLGFCFADPYKLRNLNFATIRALANRFIDFLILIPTGMDALRNQKQYERPNDPTVDNFLGNANWRDLWHKARKERTKFDRFITQEYERQMRKLGYKYGGTQESVLIRSTEKKLRLYRLSFFSRHQRGEEFWNEARKYSEDQRNLFRD